MKAEAPRTRLARLEAELKDLHQHLDTERAAFEAKISSMTQAHQELELSRDHYSGLFDHAPVGYALLDHNGFIEEANLALARMLGIERVKLRHKLLSHFVVRAHRVRIWRHITHCLNSLSAAPMTIGLKLAAAEGRQIDVALTCSSQGFPGKPLNELQLLVVVEDITSRKQGDTASGLHGLIVASINRVLEFGLGERTEAEMCQACLNLVEEVTASRISFIGEIRADGLLTTWP